MRMIRNGKIRVGSRLVLGLAVSCAILAGSGAKSQAPDSEKQFQTLIRSVRGPDLFHAYCASCHGADAKGNGPAADLKTKVPDLTILSKNNGGEFPSACVRKMIMGDDVVAAHGSREMPVWGPVFHQIEWDVDRGYLRLENLVKFLESIQTVQKKS